MPSVEYQLQTKCNYVPMQNLEIALFVQCLCRAKRIASLHVDTPVERFGILRLFKQAADSGAGYVG